MPDPARDLHATRPAAVQPYGLGLRLGPQSAYATAITGDEAATAGRHQDAAAAYRRGPPVTELLERLPAAHVPAAAALRDLLPEG